MAAPWTERDVPDQSGRTVVITGANSGIGFETARVLARRHAQVVLACRDPRKAAAARDRIRAETPAASLRTLELDLASQASVARAAQEVLGEYARVDLLINNAGALVRRHEVTEDRFERTLATNHLGAFAFTGLTLERLLTTPGSRVVTVSSVGHKRGVMNFADPHFEQGFRSHDAYFQSKLANLLFTYELQRRLAAAGAGTIALAAHPGNARTAFGSDQLPIRTFTNPRLRALTWWLLQDPATAALSVLRAATDPTATGAQYYGPAGRNEWTGHPVEVQSMPPSHDRTSQDTLWTLSTTLTGVTYPFPQPEPAPAPSAPTPDRTP